MAARFDLGQHLPRLAAIFAGRDVAGRRDRIEQVMRGTASFGCSRLGCSDVKLAIHGDGIEIHDFAVKAFGERARERGLSAGRGAKHNRQQRFRLDRSHRQRRLQGMVCQYRIRVGASSRRAIGGWPEVSVA